LEAGLDKLLINPRLKRRIRRKAKKDYRIDEPKNSLHLFNLIPTKCDDQPTLTVDDLR